MKTHNNPLLGLLFYFILCLGLIWLLSCAANHNIEKSLCLEPCTIGNVAYAEAAAGDDVYVLLMHIYGFEAQDRAVAFQTFELRKNKLTKAMGYAICYTASVEVEFKYQIEVSTQEIFIVKGVIVCQD